MEKDERTKEMPVLWWKCKNKNGNLVLVDAKRKRTYSMYGEWKIRKDGNIFDDADLLEVEEC